MADTPDAGTPDAGTPDADTPDAGTPNAGTDRPDPELLDPEVVERDESGDGDDDEEMPPGSVAEPAKVMRIGSMIKQLLEEVRMTELDDGGRNRLREIFDVSVAELSGALSPDLQDELRSLAMPFGDDEMPSDSELRIAQAQLVGWLEGLFHGIQATLFAQQVAAKNQLEQLQQQQALPQGQRPAPQGGVYL